MGWRRVKRGSRMACRHRDKNRGTETVTDRRLPRRRRRRDGCRPNSRWTGTRGRSNTAGGKAEANVALSDLSGLSVPVSPDYRCLSLCLPLALRTLQAAGQRRTLFYSQYCFPFRLMCILSAAILFYLMDENVFQHLDQDLKHGVSLLSWLLQAPEPSILYRPLFVHQIRSHQTLFFVRSHICKPTTH